ncbi:MAG: hypothetical protein AAF581_20315 [Planctomycetota bacterium]
MVLPICFRSGYRYGYDPSESQGVARPRHEQRPWTLLAVTLLLLPTAVSCVGLERYHVDSAGVPFVETPPAPYRVAIAPVILAPSFTRAPNETTQPGESARDLRFVYSADELRDQIIRTLNGHNGVSEAFPVNAPDLLQARDHDADLLLRLTWTDSYFAHEETIASRAFLSGALWLTTWFGGLFIEDSLYQASVQLRASLVNPHTGREIRRFPVETRAVELSFWDRNPVFSRSVVESFILPPFWTSDTVPETSQVLSDDAAAQLSAQLVLLFKEGLELDPPDAVASISITSPANDAQLGPAARLQATIAGAQQGTQPTIFLNGNQVATAEATVGAGGRMAIDTVLQLQPGRNKVQVRVTGGSDETLSRTIVLHNLEEAAFDDLTPTLLGAPVPSNPQVAGEQE